MTFVNEAAWDWLLGYYSDACQLCSQTARLRRTCL